MSVGRPSIRFVVFTFAVAFTLGICFVNPVFGQWTSEKPGSANIEVLSHVPLGHQLSVSDIDLEQDLERPYAYVGRMVYGLSLIHI